MKMYEVRIDYIEHGASRWLVWTFGANDELAAFEMSITHFALHLYKSNSRGEFQSARITKVKG